MGLPDEWHAAATKQRAEWREHDRRSAERLLAQRSMPVINHATGEVTEREAR